MHSKRVRASAGMIPKSWQPRAYRLRTLIAAGSECVNIRAPIASFKAVLAIVMMLLMGAGAIAAGTDKPRHGISPTVNSGPTPIAPMFLDYTNWHYPRYQYKIVPKDPQVLTRDGLHTIPLAAGALPLDMLTLGFESRHQQTRVFLVSFGGAVSNRAISGSMPPYFSGTALAKSLNLPILSFSDPTLALDSALALGWYAGNHLAPDLYSTIADLLDQISRKENLEPILVGGSGGGFAAMQVLTRLDAKAVAVVWNPQTSIGSYYIGPALKYMRIAFPDIVISDDVTRDTIAFQRFVDANFDINTFRIPDADRIRKDHQLVYLQNNSDVHHLTRHADPWVTRSRLMQAVKNIYENKTQNILYYRGNWGQGHVAPAIAMQKGLIESWIKAGIPAVQAYLRDQQ